MASIQSRSVKSSLAGFARYRASDFTSDERRWREAEPLAQLLRLILADRALTADGFRDAGARAEDVEQVGLAQAVLLHQGLEDFMRLHWREGRVLRLVIVNQLEQQTHQGILFRR